MLAPDAEPVVVVVPDCESVVPGVLVVVVVVTPGGWGLVRSVIDVEPGSGRVRRTAPTPVEEPSFSLKGLDSVLSWVLEGSTPLGAVDDGVCETAVPCAVWPVGWCRVGGATAEEDAPAAETLTAGRAGSELAAAAAGSAP